MIKQFCDYCKKEIKKSEDSVLVILEKTFFQRRTFTACPSCQKDIEAMLGIMFKKRGEK